MDNEDVVLDRFLPPKVIQEMIDQANAVKSGTTESKRREVGPSTACCSHAPLSIG